MQTYKYKKAQQQARFGACADAIAYFVGDFPDSRHGYSGFGLSIGQASPQHRTCFLGPRPAFAAGNGAPLSAGFTGSADHPYRCEPSRRCPVGDGGRVKMHVPRCGDRRGMGQSKSTGFHRQQAVGAAGGTLRDTLLAGPARRVARSECCAKQVACYVAAVLATSRRSKGPRRPALAGRTVPRAPYAARHMDSDP